MSGTVDDEVVRMRFDSTAFERGVSSTLGLLDKLKQSLSFGNAGKGFDDLESKANKFNLSGMNNQVDESARHWDLWHSAALIAFATVVHQATLAGERVVKAFTLDPVTAGFHNYETQINAVQTILANTGLKGAAGLDQVNKALGQLNDYANQTVYNFSDMAKNIGTFTAAGVQLQPATNAIKGIANLAALSGSTADQASTAMYQLSQAIAANKVGLQDWNSVVNAGMGGKVFQQALFNTGKLEGTLKGVKANETFDQWTKAGNSFRNSLQDGWITGKVLTDTLSQFTGDLTDAQLKSMGYNADQIKQIQELARTAKGAATNIKTFTQMTQALKEEVASAYGSVFKTIFGDINGATQLFTGMHNVLQNVLTNPIYALNTLLEGVVKLGGRTIFIDAVRVAFQALGNVIKPIKAAFRDIFPATTAQQVLSLIKAFHLFAEGLNPLPATVEKIHRIFAGVFALFDIGVQIVKAVVEVFSFLFSEMTKNSGGVTAFVAHIADLIVQFDKGARATGLFTTAAQIVINLIRSAEGIFGSFMVIIHALIGSIPGLSHAFDGVGGSATTAGTALQKVERITAKVSDWFQTLPRKIKPGIDAVINAFKNFGSMIAQGFNSQTFSNILKTLQTGLLFGIVVLLKRFLSNGLSVDVGGGFLGKIGEALDGVTGNLKAMQTQLKAKALLEIAAAMGILAASMVAIAQLNPTQLQNSLKAMAVGFGELLGAMGILSKISGSAGFVKIPVMAASLNLLATAILTLSLAVIALGRMSWSELERGLTAVGVLLAAVSAAAIPLSANSGGMVRAGVGITAMAVAINILYVAVRAFSSMSWGDMLHGLAGVGIALVGIAVAMRLMPKGMTFQAASLVLIAAALQGLYLAVKEFSGLDWATMGKGLAGVAGSLAAIAAGMRLMPAGMIAQSVALIAVAAALQLIARAVESMAKMSWTEMAKGLTALAGSLLILSAAMIAMTGTLGGAAALTVVAAALRLLIPSLMALSTMSWGALLQGIGKLAVVFAALAAAAMLMTPVIPELLALGAALTLLSVAVLAFGAGAALLGVGLTAIAAAGGTAIGALLSGLQGLIGLLPTLATNLATALVSFITIIGQNAPAIIGAFVSLLTQLLQAVPAIMPSLITAIGSIVQAILTVLIQNAPSIIAAGFQLLMDLLTGIQNNIGQIVTTVANIIVNFLNSLANNMPRIVAAGVQLLFAFLEGVAQAAGQIPAEAVKLIGIFFASLLGGLPQLFSAGAQLVGKLISGLLNGLGGIASAAGQLISKFINTGLNWLSDVGRLGASLIKTLIDGIGNLIGDIGKKAEEIGSAIYHGILNGIGDLVGGIAGKLKGAVGGAISKVGSFLGIGGPSKLFADEVGAPMAWGIAKGIDDNVSRVTDSLATLNQTSVLAMKKTISGLSDAISSTSMDVNPTVTPVLDLSQVQKDAGQIKDIVSANPITADVSYSKASDISALRVLLESSSGDTPAPVAPHVEIKQYNTSPTALSTVDIYRQTSNALALAKKALGVET